MPSDRVELVGETLALSKRGVERTRVVFRSLVEEREAVADVELHRESVGAQRVPVGRVVDSAPPVREEGGGTIVRVLEEQLIVRKRLVLKEELRIVRRSNPEVFRQPVRLRSERAEVERLPVSESPPAGPEGGTET